MKLLVRISFFLFLFIYSGEIFAQRDPGDTLLVHRPRYLGLFFGKIQFMGAPSAIYDQPAQPMLGKQIVKVTVGDALHGGMFFTFPFLHKMEWDAGIGVFSFQRQTVFENVTQLSPIDSTQIAAYQITNDPKRITVAEFRSYFSGELFRNDEYAILLGAGGWLATQRMPAEFSPGSIGIEANLTGYYRVHEKSFVQIHISPGWMKNGYYINFGIGICYEGQRLMRAHPKHYYVRNYDPEE